MQLALNSSLFSLEIDASYVRLGSIELFVRPTLPRERGAWFSLAYGADKTLGLAWWNVTINRVPKADTPPDLDAWELSESGPLRAPSEPPS